jgi:hypothetical protein
LLSNKAQKYTFVTTSINISKRDLGAPFKKKREAEEREEKKNKSKRINVPT